jgi:hypothetical protein
MRVRLITAVPFRKNAVSDAEFSSSECRVNVFECYEFKRQWTLSLVFPGIWTSVFRKALLRQELGLPLLKFYSRFIGGTRRDGWIDEIGRWHGFGVIYCLSYDRTMKLIRWKCRAPAIVPERRVLNFRWKFGPIQQFAVWSALAQSETWLSSDPVSNL